jgi:gluconate kinase
MPSTLLASQFATLELGDDIDPVDIDQSVEGIVEDILSRIYTKAIA